MSQGVNGGDFPGFSPFMGFQTTPRDGRPLMDANSDDAGESAGKLPSSSFFYDNEPESQRHSGFGLGITGTQVGTESLDPFPTLGGYQADFLQSSPLSDMQWLPPRSDWMGSLYEPPWMSTLGGPLPAPPVPLIPTEPVLPELQPLPRKQHTTKPQIRPFNPVPSVTGTVGSRSNSPAARVESARAPILQVVSSGITPFIPTDAQQQHRSEASSSTGPPTRSRAGSTGIGATPTPRTDAPTLTIRTMTQLKPFHPEATPESSPLTHHASLESPSESVDTMSLPSEPSTAEEPPHTPEALSQSTPEPEPAGIPPPPESASVSETPPPAAPSVPEYVEPPRPQTLPADVAPLPSQEAPKQTRSQTPKAPHASRPTPVTEVVRLPPALLCLEPQTALADPAACVEDAYGVATSASDAFVLVVWLRSLGPEAQRRLGWHAQYSSTLRADVERDRLLAYGHAAAALIDSPAPRGLRLALGLAHMEAAGAEALSGAQNAKRPQRRQTSAVQQRTLRRSRSLPCLGDPLQPRLLRVGQSPRVAAVRPPPCAGSPVRAALHRCFERWRTEQYSAGTDALPLAGVDRRVAELVCTALRATGVRDEAEAALGVVAVQQERQWSTDGVGWLALLRGRTLTEGELRLMRRHVPLELVPSLLPLVPPLPQPVAPRDTLPELLREQRLDLAVPPERWARISGSALLGVAAGQTATALLERGLGTHRSADVPPVEAIRVAEACRTPPLSSAARPLQPLRAVAAGISVLPRVVLERISALTALAVAAGRLLLTLARAVALAPLPALVSCAIAALLPHIVGPAPRPRVQPPRIASTAALPHVADAFRADAWFSRVEAMAGLAVYQGGAQPGRTVVRLLDAAPLEFAAPDCAQGSDAYARAVFARLADAGLIDGVDVAGGLAQTVRGALCTDNQELDLSFGAQRLLLRRAGDIIRVAAPAARADQSLMAAAQASVDARTRPPLDQLPSVQSDESAWAEAPSSNLPDWAPIDQQPRPVVLQDEPDTTYRPISMPLAFVFLLIWFTALFCCPGLSLAQVAAVFLGRKRPPPTRPFIFSMTPLLLCPSTLFGRSQRPLLRGARDCVFRALRLQAVIYFVRTLLFTPELRHFLALPLRRRLCVNAALLLLTVECGTSPALAQLDGPHAAAAWLLALVRLGAVAVLVLATVWFAPDALLAAPAARAVCGLTAVLFIALALVWASLALHGPQTSLARVTRDLGVTTVARFLRAR